MKQLSSDIKSIIEDEAKSLTSAFITGDISPAGGFTMTNYFSEQEIHLFTAAIIQHQLDRKCLSLVLPFLSTMKWLSMQEACIYSRKSRNTLLELIKTGKIYGTKPEGLGDYVVDRGSIDDFFNIARTEQMIHLAKIKRRGL